MSYESIDNMKVLVLDEYADQYRDLLENLGLPIDYAAGLEAISGTYEVLLAQPDLAAEYLLQTDKVRWIQSTWAGITPMLAALRQRPGVMATGVKGVFGPLISEYVFSFLLEEVRRMPHFYASQSTLQWKPVWPRSLQRQVILIIGTGSIGTDLAKVAKTFGMKVIGVSRSGRALQEFDQVVEFSQIATVVGQADCVVSTLPDTPETLGIFDADFFAQMKSSGIFFNVGRGTAVVDADLIDALNSGVIRRAVLDVFTIEPLPQDHQFWSTQGCTITPHIAAVSFPEDIAGIFRANLALYRAGERLNNLIDLEKGY